MHLSQMTIDLLEYTFPEGAEVRQTTPLGFRADIHPFAVYRAPDEDGL